MKNAFAKSDNTDAKAPNNPASPLVIKTSLTPKFLAPKTFAAATLALHLIALSALSLWIVSANPSPMSLALQFTMIATVALFAWWSSAFLMLCTYLATSGASFNGLLTASFRTAIPGVWLGS